MISRTGHNAVFRSGDSWSLASSPPESPQSLWLSGRPNKRNVELYDAPRVRGPLQLPQESQMGEQGTRDGDVSGFSTLRYLRYNLIAS